MQSLNKKGLSDIIANIMIILLSIVLISMIGIYIKDFIYSANLAPGFSCVEMISQRHLSIERACFNETSKETKILVKRGFEEFDISQLDFSIDFESESRTWKCFQGCKNCFVLNSGTTKNYYFDVSSYGVPKTINLYADGCAVSRVEVKKC